MKEFETIFLSKMDESLPDVLAQFRAGKYEKEDLQKVEALAKDLAGRYS